MRHPHLVPILCAALALLIPQAAECAPNVLTDAERAEGYELLFDGKSLDGWDGRPEFWSVEDGAIVGRTTAEILINCTSIGMHPDVDTCPLVAMPPSLKVVFDTVYNPPRTKLLALAERAGCKTVSGVEMFVNQAVAQFELWTGQPAPVDVMRRVVLENLPA